MVLACNFSQSMWVRIPQILSFFSYFWKSDEKVIKDLLSAHCIKLHHVCSVWHRVMGRVLTSMISTISQTGYIINLLYPVFSNFVSWIIFSSWNLFDKISSFILKSLAEVMEQDKILVTNLNLKIYVCTTNVLSLKVADVCLQTENNN